MDCRAFFARGDHCEFSLIPSRAAPWSRFALYLQQVLPISMVSYCGMFGGIWHHIHGDLLFMGQCLRLTDLVGIVIVFLRRAHGLD
jgi:hypothetical protein